MRISVSNVAKVTSATVEIDGVTVVAGYNGTGKSTICKALYSMCMAFGRLSQNIENSKRQSVYNCVENWDNERQGGEKIYQSWSIYAERLEQMLEEGDIFLGNLTKESLANIATGDLTEDEIQDLYEAVKKVIDRPYEEDAHFAIERIFQNCFNGQINTLDSQSVASIELQNDKVAASASFYNNSLSDSTVSQISIACPVYIETNSYLDRVVPSARRLLTGGKIPRFAIYDQKGDITLEQHNALKKARTICERIVREVTHGELMVSPQSDITYKEEGFNTNIKVGNIASGLKNFLLIQKMLDNGYLNAQSLLIIDEPEVNLHPEWQVKFADVLVQLYQKLGIRMILNTHSPYFMRAIEVKLAEYEIADKGRYYYMRQDDKGGYMSEDVTGRTEAVYRTMYKPLEDL